MPPSPIHSATLCGGLLARISLPLRDFTEALARQVFLAHPVTEVELTDRTPGQHPYEYWWWVREDNPTGTPPDDPAVIPDALFDLLPITHDRREHPFYSDDYPTQDIACRALSHACVTWGRSLAGLPPLPWTE